MLHGCFKVSLGWYFNLTCQHSGCGLPIEVFVLEDLQASSSHVLCCFTTPDGIVRQFFFLPISFVGVQVFEVSGFVIHWVIHKIGFQSQHQHQFCVTFLKVSVVDRVSVPISGGDCPTVCPLDKVNSGKVVQVV